LSKCREIRHAWTKDPDTKKKTGTSTLRAKCKEDDAARSFSLLFSKRTLDITAYSVDQCKILMEGLSALCFRIQLESLKNETKVKTEDNDSVNSQNTIAKAVSEDDWASTIYGVESAATTSMTSNAQYNQIIDASPWGV
jgi:hypothetical protein